ncbi:MAG TPA: transcriptional repressor LexA [Candidatus Paceibacterota bacterium]|nr:transcriptional repressor LexA [Candidatus Paceibacterota bacterium]
MARHTLTQNQRDTLSYLKSYITKNGQAPTVSEIGKEFKLESLRSVTQRLESLEKKGLIVRDRFKRRNIRVLDAADSPTSSNLLQVPVIASAGCDAVDVYAQDEFGEYILVDKNLLKKHTNIAAVRAVGDSMQDAGIKDGDYVIVEVTDAVENGDRVVAVLGNMAVIKQYSKVDEVVYLNPRNEGGGYHPIVVAQEDSKIFGKVLSIIPGTEWVEDVKIEYYPEYSPKH